MSFPERKTDVRNVEKTELCVDRYLIESTTFNDNYGHTFNIQGSINCKPVM